MEAKFIWIHLRKLMLCRTNVRTRPTFDASGITGVVILVVIVVGIRLGISRYWMDKVAPDVHAKLCIVEPRAASLDADEVKVVQRHLTGILKRGMPPIELASGSVEHALIEFRELALQQTNHGARRIFRQELPRCDEAWPVGGEYDRRDLGVTAKDFTLPLNPVQPAVVAPAPVVELAADDLALLVILG